MARPGVGRRANLEGFEQTLRRIPVLAKVFAIQIDHEVPVAL
jgi:hypothetical protein